MAFVSSSEVERNVSILNRVGIVAFIIFCCASFYFLNKYLQKEKYIEEQYSLDDPEYIIEPNNLTQNFIKVARVEPVNTIIFTSGFLLGMVSLVNFKVFCILLAIAFIKFKFDYKEIKKRVVLQDYYDNRVETDNTKLTNDEILQFDKIEEDLEKQLIKEEKKNNKLNRNGDS